MNPTHRGFSSVIVVRLRIVLAALLLVLGACTGDTDVPRERAADLTTTTASRRPVQLDQCIQDVVGYGTALVDATIKEDTVSFSALQGELRAREGVEGPAYQVLFGYDTFGVALQRGVREGTGAAVAFLNEDAGPRCLGVLEEKGVLTLPPEPNASTTTTSRVTTPPPTVTTLLTDDGSLDGPRSCSEAVRRSDGGPPLGPVSAARCLYRAWKASDRALALEVASIAAVDRLFNERWRAPDGELFGCLEGEAGGFQCTFGYHDRDLVMDAEGGNSVGYTISSLFFD